MRFPASILLSLLVLAPTSAQESTGADAIAPVLSRTLTRAVLKGVIGERFFKDGHGGLVRVTCRLDPPRLPTALTCEAEFRAVGAMREEVLTLRSTLGLDGHVRRSSFTLVRGRDRVEAGGAIRDGKLVLDVREARDQRSESRKVTVPWPEDTLPYTLAVFVAPLLDLPAGLRVRVFHPVTLSANKAPSTILREQGTLTLTDIYPGLDMVVRTRDGAITEVRLGRQERYQRITKAQALKLLGDSN